MPAPQSSMMKQLARLKFSQNQLKVPDGWSQPTGDPAGKHYADAFKPEERAVPPDMVVPPLVTPHSVNKYHVDVQKMINREIGDYLDGICDAICSAWSQWQSMATLVGVVVNAVTASAGQVVGPPLGPFILASGPMSTPMKMKYTSAIANAISTGWLSYTATIKVPGLPWYPAFAAVPSPVAPPMPNTPVPVIALTQVTASIMPAALKSQMIGLFADPMAMYHKEIFDAVADAFDKCFKMWQTTTMVTNVIGTGPVPTFAPPFVPAGPVVGGVGTMTPGGFV